MVEVEVVMMIQLVGQVMELWVVEEEEVGKVVGEVQLVEGPVMVVDLVLELVLVVVVVVAEEAVVEALEEVLDMAVDLVLVVKVE